MRPETDRSLTEAARDLLRAIGEDELVRTVTVCWNRRMRSAAGRAWLKEKRVDLNPALRTTEGIPDSEIDRTLRHELAHLLAQHRAGNRRIQAHGREWQRACADLGIPGETVTHDLPLPRRRQARNLRYRCPSCKTEVNRVRKFTRKVACAACCKTHNNGQFDSRFEFEGPL